MDSFKLHFYEDMTFTFRTLMVQLLHFNRILWKHLLRTELSFSLKIHAIVTTIPVSNHFRQWRSSATRSYTAFQVAGKLQKTGAQDTQCDMGGDRILPWSFLQLLGSITTPNYNILIYPPAGGGREGKNSS